jgi:hypothetical protein
MVDAYSRENGASLNPRNFPLRGLYRKGATHHTPPGIPISQPISGHTGYLTSRYATRCHNSSWLPSCSSLVSLPPFSLNACV